LKVIEIPYVVKIYSLVTQRSRLDIILSLSEPKLIYDGRELAFHPTSFGLMEEKNIVELARKILNNEKFTVNELSPIALAPYFGGILGVISEQGKSHVLFRVASNEKVCIRRGKCSKMQVSFEDLMKSIINGEIQEINVQGICLKKECDDGDFITTINEKPLLYEIILSQS
jgi:hypothetical protein